MERNSNIIVPFKGENNKFHYVYITVNLTNGKQYVGDHSSYNLEDSYLGSGSYFSNALRKHGRDNFYKIILEYFLTKRDAFIAQKIYIEKFNTVSPNGYNISPTGGLGFYESFTPEIKRKMSENHADYNGENHPRFGKTHTIESKRKNSETKIAFYQTEEGIAVRKKISESKKEKTQSEESNEKRRKTQTGRKRPIEVGLKISNSLRGKKYSEERKQKNREAQIERMKNPELREKQRIASLNQWANPEWRKNHIGENYRSHKKIA